ncbi:MAG: zonular occludens toxin domain-containing protein [Methylococcales bacterium]|nr:zonular occludens toxin domain-containing protein [Methylococcales bacterium]
MITLITGTPGSGKTAFALDMMVRQTRLDNARKLYVHGIPELKLPHEIVACDSPSCDYCCTLPPLDIPTTNFQRYTALGYLRADMWHEYAEKGAILFFDEVQNIHRNRNPATPVPPSVAAYEVHRHRGLDFFLITQNPSLIDGNVRALVSRHIHLSSTWARRLQFEFPQCKTDLAFTTGEGVKSNYVLPKEVFSLYKSASLHTKLERKTPFALYGIGIVLVLIAILVFYEYNSFKKKMTPATPVTVSASVEKQNLSAQATGGASVRDPKGARAGATPVVALNESKREILDMPKLFKKWSQLGIGDDDLKFLPIGMCAVSSTNFVKCHFPQKLSFKHFFSSIACTPENCFAFLKRIPPVEIRQHEPMPTPQLPFSADSITQASN